MLGHRRRDTASSRHRREPLLELTCVVDGHSHLVAVDAFASAAAATRGAFTALCGHEVTACSMASPPGPECRACDDLRRQAS